MSTNKPSFSELKRAIVSINKGVQGNLLRLARALDQTGNNKLASEMAEYAQMLGHEMDTINILAERHQAALEELGQYRTHFESEPQTYLIQSKSSGLHEEEDYPDTAESQIWTAAFPVYVKPNIKRHEENGA